ncbi:hypothetical protein RQP46_001032 [Phenoliferia psychrophenolica]
MHPSLGPEGHFSLTSGTRLTLVYDIFSSTSSLPSPPLPISTSNTPFQTKLGSLLKSPDFLPAGGRLAIALAHAYPVERLSSGTASRDNDKYTKDLPGRLVGIDAIVYATSADLGIPVDFRAVYEEQARAVFRSAALEAPWWDETAVFNSEDDKEEAFMEACIDNVYGPILDDDYIPIDAFASRYSSLLLSHRRYLRTLLEVHEPVPLVADTELCPPLTFVLWSKLVKSHLHDRKWEPKEGACRYVNQHGAAP